jgi:protoporphyrinogen IX oxidase
VEDGGMTIAALSPFYLWIKAFHVIAMVAWMAEIFYLPRLFVYHCGVLPGTAESERFKVMERRLLKQIGTPAMIATWLFGIALVLTPGVVDWHDGWWHVKLLSVLLMTGFQGAMSKWRRNFMEDSNIKSHKFYRVANEVPTILLLVIVIMVIVKPF